MERKQRLINLYRAFLKYWNAILAGASLLGVAIFSVVPELEFYAKFFVFLAANAVVWTVIEMKVKLEESPVATSAKVHRTMRAARPDIISDIANQMDRSRRGDPLTLTLIGGRLRSMGDIVREIADRMDHGELRGHLSVHAFCIDPDYLSARILAGEMSPSDQTSRNVGIGHLVRSVKSELEGLSKVFSPDANLSISVTYYSEDPFCYAYLIGTDALYWGPFTWDKTTSDLLGPENPCILVKSTDPSFTALREWIETRTALMSASIAVRD
jgi:hypothetical protein